MDKNTVRLALVVLVGVIVMLAAVNFEVHSDNMAFTRCVEAGHSPEECR